MAKAVVWSIQATDDIYSIFSYLSEFSEPNAERIAGEIINAVERLEQFPRLGRIVPELNIESIRELFVQHYRIVYKVQQGNDVEILAIRHSSRNISDV